MMPIFSELAGPAAQPSQDTTDAEIAQSPQNSAYTEVVSAIWRYYEALARPDDVSRLDAIVDAAWHGKSEDPATDQLRVETRSQLASRQPLLDAAPPTDLQLTTLHVLHEDLAIARVDEWEQAEVTILTLFRTAAGWRVAGTSSSGAAFGRREQVFRPATAEAEVLQTLDVYYRSVEAGDAAELETVLHPLWHMKNLEGPALYSEDTPTFCQRVADHGPYPGYVDDRQIADVQMIADHLAVVRIDKPSTQTVVVFSFFRIDGRWWMVDKAWVSVS